jgi:hypothetical protein
MCDLKDITNIKTIAIMNNREKKSNLDAERLGDILILNSIL